MSDNTQKVYQQCSRCIMDTNADKNLAFDKGGLCNHCNRYDQLVSARVLKGSKGKEALSILVDKIKSVGKNKDYDCIVGVSGGVDSTYVAYLVKKLGLRPLAIHFDNGWNSELAVKNIERVLKKLDIDLYTYVIDWEEFKDLQIAFLRASTPDGEIPTDHAINALLWRKANELGIRYIISGMNFATESFNVLDWAYGHSDWRYIKDVHRKYGKVKLRTYPYFNFFYLLYVNAFCRIRTISILNYVDYHKEDAMDVLKNQLSWVYYGGKHYESIYTRFYQGYVLPKKFGIDKRYGHLSDLINAGQISKDKALQEIKKPTYAEDKQLEDLEYVAKKLGLELGEFEDIMNQPIKSFRDYKNSFGFVSFIKALVNRMRLMGVYPR